MTTASEGGVGPTEKTYGRECDKGHFIAHSLGGAVDKIGTECVHSTSRFESRLVVRENYTEQWKSTVCWNLAPFVSVDHSTKIKHPVQLFWNSGSSRLRLISRGNLIGFCHCEVSLLICAFHDRRFVPPAPTRWRASRLRFRARLTDLCQKVWTKHKGLTHSSSCNICKIRPLRTSDSTLGVDADDAEAFPWGMRAVYLFRIETALRIGMPAASCGIGLREVLTPLGDQLNTAIGGHFKTGHRSVPGLVVRTLLPASGLPEPRSSISFSFDQYPLGSGIAKLDECERDAHYARLNTCRSVILRRRSFYRNIPDTTPVLSPLIIQNQHT